MVSKRAIPPEITSIVYEKLLENPYIGINITNHEGTVIYVNPTHTRITGQEPSYYIGRNMKTLCSENLVSKSATSEVLRVKKEVLINQNTSSGKSFQVKAIPILDEQKNIKYILNYLFDVSELVQIKETISKIQKDKKMIEGQYVLLKQTLKNDGNLIYQSKVMQNIVERAIKVADNDVTVLITGSSGCGKELIADIIHKESKRSKKPFIKINCAAIPEQLLESEFFGYEPGAFTGGSSKGKKGLFEEAENGTILLDEIGELPLSLQAKLLHTLQEQEIRRIGGTKNIHVNFRLIASTNASLTDMIAEKKFREDLYYRLNIISIVLPDLKDRSEDIPLLVEHFVHYFNSKYEFNKVLAPDALQYLTTLEYPGNIRELRNLLERIMVQTYYDHITLKDVCESLGRTKTSREESARLAAHKHPQNSSLKQIMEDYEKKIIEEYLQNYKTTTEVAKQLKTDQSTISRKINRYQIKY